MKLYDSPLSGNCYKIRLFLSLLNLEHENVRVDLFKGESRTDEFLALNARGQVPVLDDDGLVIQDSMAILIYLARKYGDESWLPNDANKLALVSQWLAFAADEITGLAYARAALEFGRPYNVEERQKLGITGLKVIEQQLGDNDWLALGHVTIADIACFPYVALAPQAGVSLDEYVNVRTWIDRIKRLPNYIDLPQR